MIARDATPADAAALAALFERSFTETFAHLYQPADLAAFLSGNTPAHWAAQLADGDYAIRIAVAGETLAGFAKLGPVVFPGAWPAHAIELHQLYVLGEWHGDGVGQALMRWAIDAARRRGAADLLLSVFVDNLRARRFYERQGFAVVGRYAFMVGAQADEDHIMRLAL